MRPAFRQRRSYTTPTSNKPKIPTTISNALRILGFFGVSTAAAGGIHLSAASLGYRQPIAQNNSQSPTHTP